ncbi:MAG: transketolase family protein [Clostridia bacterium]|nr:transketolase family protein [Clostridia bacterium]
MADMKAQRDAYGEVLAELGRKYPNMFVLDADLTKSTKTVTFQKEFPERHINCGIAEGNMMAVAAGIATCGNIVFASSFAMFAAGRAYEQIRNSVCYAHNNVKIVATHAGLTVGEDGATHQCLEDIGLMRAIPGMVVLAPSDAGSTKAACRFAAEYDGPVYIRLGRLPLTRFNDEENYKFSLGQADVLADGDFATVMFCGPFYDLAMQIREIFAKNNMNIRVVDVPCIKPMNKDVVKNAANETKVIVTIEDHNIYGGLGSAVAEVLAEEDIENRNSVELIRIGAQDIFGKSGAPKALLEKYGFSATEIAKKIAETVCPGSSANLMF